MKDLSWLKETLIAHRGLHSEDTLVPENSLLSFKLAMDHGYGIELDINFLKDHTIVAFHDGTLTRMTGINKKLKHTTLEEIKPLRLLNSDEKIPTLHDVLSLVKGKVPLLIEIKSHGHIKTFCKTFYEQMKSYHGAWAVFSFDPRVVLWFKKHAPHVLRGQISSSFNHPTIFSPLKYMLKRLMFNGHTKPDFVSYNVLDLPNKYVDRAQKKGICIIGFVARKQEQLEFMRAHYSNLVFEFFIPN